MLIQPPQQLLEQLPDRFDFGAFLVTKGSFATCDVNSEWVVSWNDVLDEATKTRCDEGAGFVSELGELFHLDPFDVA